MEKETRNAIERATQRARELLEAEFAEQLEGTYDVLLSGSLAKRPGPHLGPRERLVRERIVASIEHKQEFPGRQRRHHGARGPDLLRRSQDGRAQGPGADVGAPGHVPPGGAWLGLRSTFRLTPCATNGILAEREGSGASEDTAPAGTDAGPAREGTRCGAQHGHTLGDRRSQDRPHRGHRRPIRRESPGAQVPVGGHAGHSAVILGWREQPLATHAGGVMAPQKARTRARRTARGSAKPQVYRVPGVRVSVVRERWVRLQRRPVIRTTRALAAALSACIPADDEREHFVMAVFDVRRRLLGLHTLSIGCLTGSIVHPRELLRVAVLMGACTISVGHNHCSGDPEPSSEDVELTWRLMSCLELLGIGFGDHIVLGRGRRWVSMRKNGYLEAAAQQRRSPRGQHARSKTAAMPAPKCASGS